MGMTINEALVWQKALKARHAELIQLRNENSRSERRYFGAHADKEVEHQPTYDVKALDRLVQGVAKELRLLDLKLKATNATTEVIGYTPDETVMGELS